MVSGLRAHAKHFTANEAAESRGAVDAVDVLLQRIATRVSVVANQARERVRRGERLGDGGGFF